MNPRLLFLLSLVLVSAGTAQAETLCPWLTQGTAAAMLGGEVSAVIKLMPPDQGSCTFSRQQGTVAYSLEVIVESTPRATCPPASPKLSGVGNEAVSCRVQRSPNEAAEVITSRVRTLYFTVSLTTQGTANSATLLPRQKDIVERAAEQVAGNLF